MNNNNNTIITLPWTTLVKIIDYIFYDKITPLGAKIELGLVSWNFFNYLKKRSYTVSLSFSKLNNLQQHLDNKYCIIDKINNLEIYIHTLKGLDISNPIITTLANSVERLSLINRNSPDPSTLHYNTDGAKDIVKFLREATNLKLLQYWIVFDFKHYLSLFSEFNCDNLESFKLFGLENMTPIESDHLIEYLFDEQKHSRPMKLTQFRGMASQYTLTRLEPYFNQLTKISLFIDDRKHAVDLFTHVLPAMTSNLESLRVCPKPNVTDLEEMITEYLESSIGINGVGVLKHLHLHGSIGKSDRLLNVISYAASESKLQTLSIPAALLTTKIRVNVSKITIHQPHQLKNYFISENSIVKRLVFKTENDTITSRLVFSFIKNNNWIQHVKGISFSDTLVNSLKERIGYSLRAIDTEVDTNNFYIEESLIVPYVLECISHCKSINSVNINIHFNQQMDNMIYSGFKCFNKYPPYYFLRIDGSL